MGTAFGDALRDLRTQAGLSLAALARQMSYSKSHVGNVETGVRTADDAFVAAADRALGTAPLLALLHHHQGGDVQRRALLAHIGAAVGAGVAVGGLADVVRHGLLDSSGAGEDWDARVAEARRAFVTDPDEAFGAGLLTDLMVIRQALVDGHGNRADLLRAGALLGQLYGLWLGNTGELAGAARWYRSAATLADQSGDTDTRTFTRGRSLSRAVYESYTIRETLAGTDEVFAISDRPSEGAMEAYGARVSAYAIVGDAAAGRTASAGMARIAAALPAGTGAGARAAFVDAFAECRYGDLDQAQAAVDEALPLLADWPLWATETRVYLGRAMVAGGDVAGGVDYALAALAPMRHQVRVIAVAVGDLLAAVPARHHRADQLAALRAHATTGPAELAS